MSVTINDADAMTLDFGAPERLFEYSFPVGITGTGFALSRDGRRFLMLDETTEGLGRRAQINVVLNWLEELKELVPVN